MDVSRAVIRPVPDASGPTPFVLLIEAGVKTSCVLCAPSLQDIQVFALALLARANLVNPASAADYRTRQTSLLQQTLDLDAVVVDDATRNRKKSVGNRMMSFMSGGRRGTGTGTDGAATNVDDGVAWEAVDA